MISGMFYIIIIILFIWLIVNRVNQKDKEKFDKRKN
jgi:flagellar biogenesis protein FliO